MPPARAIHLTIATIPLALFLLGFVLHRFRPTLDQFVNLTILIRLVGSTLLGGVICVLLDLRGPDGAAVLIGAGLPAAVFSYVLAQRYDKDPGFAAGAVFYTSLVSALSLPGLLFLARMWYPPPFP